MGEVKMKIFDIIKNMNGEEAYSKEYEKRVKRYKTRLNREQLKNKYDVSDIEINHYMDTFGLKRPEHIHTPNFMHYTYSGREPCHTCGKKLKPEEEYSKIRIENPRHPKFPDGNMAPVCRSCTLKHTHPYTRGLLKPKKRY